MMEKETACDKKSTTLFYRKILGPAARRGSGLLASYLAKVYTCRARYLAQRV